MMLQTILRGWNWFVDGLTDAAAWIPSRLRSRDVYQILAGERGGTIRGPDGVDVGRLDNSAGPYRIEPPIAAAKLRGGHVDLLIPSAWLFRRDLDPVPAESAPYLDAFVKHQIERITPWRAGDVHYAIVQAPLPSDAARLAVEVGVVPKRLVDGLVEPLRMLHPERLRLVAAAANGTTFAIPMTDATQGGRATLRSVIGTGLIVSAGAMIAALGWMMWETGAVQADIEAEDQVISGQKAVLAAVLKRDQASSNAESVLTRLQASRLPAVSIIEALSAALPDSAYLTELAIDRDQVRIAGISTETPQLVPALERSGRFTAASFYAATTRLDTGAGDRFFLEMRAVAPAKATPP